MNRLSIGFGCLLIFFNLFACRSSYAMVEGQYYPTMIPGGVIVADLFFGRTPEKHLRSGVKQARESDNGRKKFSADLEDKGYFRIKLVREFFSDKKKSSQESWIEMKILKNFHHSSSGCVEDTNTEE